MIPQFKIHLFNKIPLLTINSLSAESVKSQPAFEPNTFSLDLQTNSKWRKDLIRNIVSCIIEPIIYLLYIYYNEYLGQF